MTLFITIYLIGYIISYLLARKCFKHLNKGSWTISDRREVLIMSIFSWCAVGASLVYYFSDMRPDEKRKRNNTPAKW